MKHSYFSMTVFFAIAMVLAATCGVKAESEAQSSQTNLPSVVRQAFEKDYPHTKIEGVHTEVEDKDTFYEIETLDGKVKRKVLYSEDGKLTKIEERINTSDIPPAVVKTINDAYPGGRIEQAEKVIRGEEIKFEILLKSSGHTYDLFLSQEGQFVPNEEESESIEDDD